MLKKQIELYVKQNKVDEKVTLFPEESNYFIETNILPEEEIQVTSKVDRFLNLYLELANKETEELIKDNVPSTFLEEKITYLKENIEEYLYIESPSFAVVSTDGFIIEVDSVFGTYELIVGLHMPKKLEKDIRSYLDDHLHGDQIRYSLLFNGQDGLWEVNLPLDNMGDFHQDMSLAEAIKLAYLFLFDLGKTLEK